MDNENNVKNKNEYLELKKFDKELDSLNFDANIKKFNKNISLNNNIEHELQSNK